MAPHGRFLQHRSQTARLLTGGCECIKHTLPPLAKTCWSIFLASVPMFFVGRDFRVGIALSSRKAPVESCTWMALL